MVTTGTVVNVIPPDTLNVRDKPGMEGRVIGHMPNGAHAEVLGKQGEWYEIKTDLAQGYVHSSYLQVVDEGPGGGASAPTSRQRVAVLDPGHFHNHNKGALEGYWEGNAMLDYAFVLKRELDALGWKTILTRTDGNDLGLTARGKIAIRNKADLFYSLHSNACGVHSVRRVTAFYSVDRPGDRDFVLAQAEAVAGVMGSPSYHAEVRASTVYHSKPDPSALEDYYTVIDTASDGGVPHVLLLEHDFHTNPDVCRFLMDKSCLARLAKAEAASIDKHIV